MRIFIHTHICYSNLFKQELGVDFVHKVKLDEDDYCLEV